MRRRWAWLAAGGGFVATTASIACGPTETSCEESATCPPPGMGGAAGATGSAGASGASADSGGGTGGGGGAGGDAGIPEDAPARPDADVSVDTPRPPNDVSAPDGRDARSDVAIPDDTGRDTVVPDAPPVIDAASEPDACDPGTSKSPMESACLISEKYGIFVSPQGSDTTGVGTRAAPYKTLTKALQGAKGNVMRVYACDEGSGYTDALTVDAT
ncbi:MAG TPA: hypothetical protein VK550_12850, partial [Polyangiaceae bacterium]|nr:hypothetical protein [Polyangiaceae bacterium]